MKCKIENEKFVIEFDIESEKDIDNIIEELDLALKPSEIRLLKESLNVSTGIKHNIKKFLFDGEMLKRFGINNDKPKSNECADNRANTLFSELGYDINDEDVKVLIDNFQELSYNKVLNFTPSTKPKMLLTFFNVFNYDDVVKIEENKIQVLNDADLYRIKPTYKEHEEVQDVSWGVEKTAQLSEQELAKIVIDKTTAEAEFNNKVRM